MKDENTSNQFDKMQLNLARHNLEVTLKRIKESCFRAARKVALESPEQAKQMDVFVRKQYSNEPRKMAEWNKLMEMYEFQDQEIED